MWVIKVSDFGLSEHLNYSKDYIRQNKDNFLLNGRLPRVCVMDFSAKNLMWYVFQLLQHIFYNIHMYTVAYKPGSYM